MGFLRYAWLIPLVSALVFLGGVSALLAPWAIDGHPQYNSSYGSLVDISDVTARKRVLWVGTFPISADY